VEGVTNGENEGDDCDEVTKIQMVLDLEYHLSFDYIYMHILRRR